MTARGRHLRRVVAVALAALAVAATAASPARADERPGAVTGVVVRSDGGAATQHVALGGIHPGSRHRAVLLLEGDDAAGVTTVAVDVPVLRELENGCNRPERRVPDDTCGGGDDQGELGGFLDVRVAVGTQQDGGACLVGPSTPPRRLATLPAEGIVVRRPAGTTDTATCLVLDVAHAVEGPIDNLTQTDGVVFDLALRFEGEPGDEVEVLPAALDAPTGGRTVVPGAVLDDGGSLVLGLPATGAPVLVLAGVALLLVGSGGLLRGLARERAR